MRQIAIRLIGLYQSILSPDTGIFSRGRKYCRFSPSCSEYAKNAMCYGGVLYGLRRGVARILRCHPWQKIYYDPFKP